MGQRENSHFVDKIKTRNVCRKLIFFSCFSWSRQAMGIRLLWAAIVCLAAGNASEIRKLNIGALQQCPYLFPYVYEGYMPANKSDAGKYEEKKELQTLEDCIEGCCDNQDCNVVFMFTSEGKSTCYHVSNDLTVPVCHLIA